MLGNAGFKIVVIKEIKSETKSGLQVVETGKNKPEVGEIVAIGTGAKPIPLKIGDVIIYRKYMDNKVYVPYLGEELNFIDFKDIVYNLGKIKSEKE